MTYPHLTIQDQLDQIKANNTGAPKNITILGAGMAGLAAAYVLRQHGHKVTIYEGSNRIGGRIFTHRFAEDPTKLYGELGAMRVPASHDYTLYFINLLNLPLRKFLSAFDNDLCFLHMRDKVARIQEQVQKINPRYGLSEREAKLRGTMIMNIPIFQKLMQGLTDQEKIDLFDGKTSTPALEAMERFSIGAFMRDNMQGADAEEFASNITVLGGIWETAIAKFVRDGFVGVGTGLQEIVGGMDLLPLGLADKVKDAINLNTEVMSIRIHDQSVDITLKSASGNQTITSDYVLCTLPFPVLRRLNLKGFSHLKLNAINAMNYAAATKVLLNCKERFWETRYGIFGGASISDRISRSTYYPSDHVSAGEVAASKGMPGVGPAAAVPQAGNQIMPTSIGGPGVLLASYVVGADAVRLGALGAGERANVVKRSIANFHPEINDAGMVLGNASMAWDTNKWSCGAFANLWPGQMPRIHQSAIAPDGRVFFAGEHCSAEHGWIQGSLISALRAVEDIVKY